MTRIPTRLEAIAKSLGVHVRFGWVPEGTWGTYDADLHLITLRWGLGPVQLLCTLMHELGHAANRHRGHNARQEREANAWAAVRLIGRDDLVNAVVVESTLQAVAHNLGVLPDVVRDYIESLTPGERRDIDAAVRAAIAA